MIRIIEIALILVTILINFFLAVTIFIRSKSNRKNILFAVLTATFSVWGTCLLLYEHPIILTSRFWLQGAYLSATLMELFIVAFAFVFPRSILRKVWLFVIIYGILFTAFTIYYLYFTHLWIIRVNTIHGIVSTAIGPVYWIWTLGEWVLIFISLWALFSSYRRARGFERVQLQFLIAGFFIFGFSVNIFDVIFPLVFHNTRFFGISSILGLIFTGTISYIILRHRFFDLQRTLRQVGYYALAILFLGTIYYGIVFLIGKYFFPHQFFPVYTLVVVSGILLFRFATTPLRNNFGKRMKKMFIQGMYDRDEVLIKLNDLTTHTISLNTMVENTLKISYETFLPEFALGLSMFDGKISVFKSYAPKKRKEITMADNEARFIAAIDAITITDELPGGNLKTFLQKKRIAVVLPFNTSKWKRYILLGYKQAEESYYTYDITTFAYMQPVLRLMGQHVRQVEEIRQFNRKLRSEVEKATLELRTVNKHLKVADKLKDEFISIASHELKTPTTAIQGFLWLVLQKDKELSRYSRDKLERVAKLTEHMTTLINDMLDVSKIESKRISLHPEIFDIRGLVQEIKGELDLFAVQKSLEIQVTNGEKCLVWADRQRMHQVVSNLMNNALKYTSEKGKIKVSLIKKDSEIVVSIADSGVGIREEDMPKLFTKFGKLDSNNNPSANLPGTGLGLYITKNLVELSGGTISVKSQFGKGSTFVFTLPTHA